MTKNLSVVDTKPANSQVVDVKPANKETLTDYGSEQLFTVVIKAGQWMGFGALTYPTAGTVQSSITA